MYNLTRQEAAEKLGVSTRSIDRYIKAGKIRSQKDGKIVYVNSEDIDNLSGNTEKKQEIIIEKKPKVEEKKSERVKQKVITKEVEVKKENNTTAVEMIFGELKKEIVKKDEIIKELAIRVGEAEEKAKNSVNLIDYKKSQFLLEESRSHLNNEIDDLKDENTDLHKKLKYEKNSNVILIFLVIILFIVAAIIFFLNI